MRTRANSKIENRTNKNKAKGEEKIKTHRFLQKNRTPAHNNKRKNRNEKRNGRPIEMGAPRTRVGQSTVGDIYPVLATK